MMKMEDPPKESALRGIAIHKSLEKAGIRLMRGESAIDNSDPWVKFVQAVSEKGLLPPAGEKHVVEHRFSLKTHTGYPWRGVIDVMRDEITPFTMIDWKSTSDIRYAKTPADLLVDIQLASYAEYAWQAGVPANDIIKSGLVYVEAKKIPLKKKLPHVVPVFVELDRRRVRALWESTKPTLDDMLRVAAYDDFNDVTPNTNSCEKYGGCAFKATCGISPFSNISKPQTKVKIMGYFDKKTNGSNGNTTTPPPAATTPSAPAPSATPARGGFLSRTGALPTPVPKVTQGVPVGVTPDDAPPRNSVPEPEAEVAVAQDDGAETPKKRGRRTKAQIEADNAATASAAGAENLLDATQDEPPTSVTASPTPVPTAGKAREFTLYLGCLVTKSRDQKQIFDFSDWWSTIENDLNAAASAEGNVPHYMMLAFGEQKAALAMKVQEAIARGLPPAMFIDSSAPAAREVLPYLLPHATTVIRAVRG